MDTVKDATKSSPKARSFRYANFPRNSDDDFSRRARLAILARNFREMGAAGKSLNLNMTKVVV